MIENLRDWLDTARQDGYRRGIEDAAKVTRGRLAHWREHTAAYHCYQHATPAVVAEDIDTRVRALLPEGDQP